jgi:N-acetylneuraminic acid mutarotase
MTTLLVVAAIFIGPRLPDWKWKRLPSLPDKEGFAGPFAGTSRGVLLVAGGANFPEKKPWEGGKKVWYDTVFTLDRPDGEWRVAGMLPRPLGYGVSVTHRDGVVCVGGSNSERHHADAFRLEWNAGKVVASPLPPLPRPVANACGAMVGDSLVAAPSPASVEGSGFFLLGGDDGSKVGFSPPERHPGFRREILRFDRETETWAEAGVLTSPRVTAPLVRWNDTWVMPSGEVRPGVRSPEVWSFSSR